jgi:hypothetical protein
MTRPKPTLALLLASFAMLAFTGCRSHTTVVEPTRTVVQPVPVPARHDYDNHHDDHQPPPPPPPRRDDRH